MGRRGCTFPRTILPGEDNTDTITQGRVCALPSGRPPESACGSMARRAPSASALANAVTASSSGVVTARFRETAFEFFFSLRPIFSAFFRYFPRLRVRGCFPHIIYACRTHWHSREPSRTHRKGALGPAGVQIKHIRVTVVLFVNISEKFSDSVHSNGKKNRVNVSDDTATNAKSI